MAFGDRLVADNQIEWGGCLLASTGWVGSPPAEAVIPPGGVTGLASPDVKANRTPLPLGPGAFAGLDTWATRKIAITGLHVDRSNASAVPALLASMAPRGPSNEQEIAWRGFQWPAGRKFRAWARPDRPADVFDAQAAIGGIAHPDLAWECTDPFAYDFDLSGNVTVSPGATAAVTSHGGWETTRITVTWTGPYTAPGISSSVVAGGAIWFATLNLEAGQTITASFHRHFGRSLTSNHFPATQLWQAAIGAGPSVAYPPPKLFPLLPGAQNITALGTGTGTMQIAWRDAWATPAMP